jgi:hypothetical protein
MPGAAERWPQVVSSSAGQIGPRNQSSSTSAVSRHAVVHQHMPQLLQMLQRLRRATPVLPRVWLCVQRRCGASDHGGIQDSITTSNALRKTWHRRSAKIVGHITDRQSNATMPAQPDLLYLLASSRRIAPVAVAANAGSPTNNSTSCCKSTGPWTCASISVSSTRPASPSDGSFRGCGSSWRMSNRRGMVSCATPSVGARNGGHGGAAIPLSPISASNAAITLCIRPMVPRRSVARGSSLPMNVKEVRSAALCRSTK